MSDYVNELMQRQAQRMIERGATNKELADVFGAPRPSKEQLQAERQAREVQQAFLNAVAEVVVGRGELPDPTKLAEAVGCSMEEAEVWLREYRKDDFENRRKWQEAQQAKYSAARSEVNDAKRRLQRAVDALEADRARKGLPPPDYARLGSYRADVLVSDVIKATEHLSAVEKDNIAALHSLPPMAISQNQKRQKLHEINTEIQDAIRAVQARRSETEKLEEQLRQMPKRIEQARQRESKAYGLLAWHALEHWRLSGHLSDIQLPDRPEGCEVIQVSPPLSRPWPSFGVREIGSAFPL